MRLARFATVICLIGFVSASLAKVQVQHDPNADFAAYQTYAWIEGTPATTEQFQNWIVESIDKELQSKGLKRVAEDEADVFVKSLAFGESEIIAGGSYAVAPTWNVGILRVDVRDVTTGSLMIELVDPGTEQPVWRAIGSETMDRREPNKIRQKIQKVARKMFRKFPPK
jgi:hypothetical protein